MRPCLPIIAEHARHPKQGTDRARKKGTGIAIAHAWSDFNKILDLTKGDH